MKRYKKYEEYKANKGIKAPLIAWAFDRPLIYISLVIASVFAILGIFSNAVEKVNAMKDPYIETPWLDIDPDNPPAINWLLSFSSNKPLESWDVEKMGSSNIPGCSSINGVDTPASLLGSVVSGNSNTTSVIQAYSPGQAIAELENYKNLLEDCHVIERVEEDNYQGYKWKDGFAITSGDAIVGVSGEDSDALFGYYKVNLPATLSESGCKTLFVSPSASGRNFFYDRANYTGYLIPKTLKPEIEISDLPTPTNLTLKDQVWTGEVQEPEAPLPKNFPKMPKAESRPTVPEFQLRREITKTIEIEEADPIGPGCGWSWSGQDSPIYNESELKEAATASIAAAQKSVNEEATSYLRAHSSWVQKILNLYPSINSWNKYALESDSVKDAWWKFTVAREDFKPLWMEYVQAVNDYNSFDEKFLKAKNEYDTAVKACNAKQLELEEWEKLQEEIEKENQGGEAKPNEEETERPSTSTDEPATAKPEGCSTSPEKPSILNQVKPARPVAPTLPEGITIPNSWPKPVVVERNAATQTETAEGN